MMEVATLGEVCQFVGGGTPSRKREEFFRGDIPWATVKDFKGYWIEDTEEHITDAAVASSATNIVDAGTVLLVTRVGLGKVGIAKRRLAINQDIKAVVPNERVLPEYVFWFLLSQGPTIERMGTGATVKGVTLQDVRALRIPVPTPAEQRSIVDILTRAEGIVRLRRQAEAKANAIIPALFIDMFGDPAINPKGWREEPLSALVEGFKYGTSTKSGAVGLPALRIPNVVRDALDPTDIKLVAADAGDVERLRLKDGDLLFVRTNGNPEFVGRSAVYQSEVMDKAGYDGGRCLFASYLIRARLKKGSIKPTFLQTFLSSREGRRRLRDKARTSAGQYNINTVGLGSIVVPLPPESLQRLFEELADRALSVGRQQTSALVKAEATFAALLSRKFSSEQA